MAIFKGGVLIEITSPWTSSLLVMFFATTLGNQLSKGGNSIRASEYINLLLRALCVAHENVALSLVLCC